MAAPRNGMNTGTVAAIPWRRISTKWPISWTNSIAMRAPANSGPRSQAYAPKLTPAERSVAKAGTLTRKMSPYLTTAHTARAAEASQPRPPRLPCWGVGEEWYGDCGGMSEVAWYWDGGGKYWPLWGGA